MWHVECMRCDIVAVCVACACRVAMQPCHTHAVRCRLLPIFREEQEGVHIVLDVGVRRRMCVCSGRAPPPFRLVARGLGHWSRMQLNAESHIRVRHWHVSADGVAAAVAEVGRSVRAPVDAVGVACAGVLSRARGGCAARGAAHRRGCRRLVRSPKRCASGSSPSAKVSSIVD